MLTWLDGTVPSAHAELTLELIVQESVSSAVMSVGRKVCLGDTGERGFAVDIAVRGLAVRLFDQDTRPEMDVSRVLHVVLPIQATLAGGSSYRFGGRRYPRSWAK
jgi:4-diphosphocytidyl-2C-methyl-D-erythritol kinase